MLGLLGAAAVGGSAGCTQLGREKYRLHFVRIYNGSANEVDIDIRVRSDGEITFETAYEGIPSFKDVDQDSENPEADFVDEPNIRLVESEWGDEPAVYDLEYKLSGQESWSEADFDDPEAEHAAVDMMILGGVFGTSATFQALEFEDEDQVDYVLGREETHD